MAVHPAPAPAQLSEQVPVPSHWYRGVYTSNVAHTQAAERTRFWARGLGVLVVAFSTVTGTTLFTTLSEAPSERTRAGVGAVAVLAALLAAFNTFFNFGEASDSHRKAGAHFGALKHELDEVLSARGTMIKADLDDFRNRWDELIDDEPTLPPRAWKRARKYVDANPPQPRH